MSEVGNIPVLTEVVELPQAQAGPLQERLVQALPELVRQTVQELQPQLEQQLLDALMPRLLASLSGGLPPNGPQLTSPLDSGLPRLP